MKRFIGMAFQLCSRMRHQEDPRKLGSTGNEWNTSASGLY
jgi:hypothetical protein